MILFYTLFARARMVQIIVFYANYLPHKTQECMKNV